MTEQEKADVFVSRLMHDAHLRYQRQQAQGVAQTQENYVSVIPSSEVRGVSEARRAVQTWKPEWSTHLRPNFWIAYFDTLMFMAK